MATKRQLQIVENFIKNETQRIMKEGLNIKDLLKIRNSYYKRYNDLFEEFTAEYSETDKDLIPTLKLMKSLDTEFENYLKRKGVL